MKQEEKVCFGGVGSGQQGVIQGRAGHLALDLVGGVPQVAPAWP